MTPWQCRDARNLLKWSQDDLAADSRVPAEIVAMFDEGKLVRTMDLHVAVRSALEEVGIAFPRPHALLFLTVREQWAL